MRRSIIAVTLLCLAVALAACTGEEPDDTGDPDAEVAGTPTPEPEEPTYPLTGEPVDDESDLERPVLAVKIDNHPRARPQDDLGDADVVMVEKVEGTTRFVSLFHSASPDHVGPVRSGRFVDGDLLPPFQPAFAISGAADVVLSELNAVLDLYGEGSADAWTRDGSRPKPHNLFLDTEPLFDAAADDGLPPAEQPWTFAAGEDADLSGGREVTTAELSYRDAEEVRWQWEGGEFVRSQDGQAHRLADETQVAADNVIIVRAPATGDLTRPFDPIGSGELVLLRDGEEHTGTWEKGSSDDHFRWLGDDGESLPLAPGRSWIELVPDDGSVTVEGPAGAGDGSDDADDADADDTDDS